MIKSSDFLGFDPSNIKFLILENIVEFRYKRKVRPKHYRLKLKIISMDSGEIFKNDDLVYSDLFRVIYLNSNESISILPHVISVNNYLFTRDHFLTLEDLRDKKIEDILGI